MAACTGPETLFHLRREGATFESGGRFLPRLLQARQVFPALVREVVEPWGKELHGLCYRRVQGAKLQGQARGQATALNGVPEGRGNDSPQDCAPSRRPPAELGVVPHAGRHTGDVESTPPGLCL